MVRTKSAAHPLAPLTVVAQNLKVSPKSLINLILFVELPTKNPSCYSGLRIPLGCFPIPVVVHVVKSEKFECRITATSTSAAIHFDCPLSIKLMPRFGSTRAPFIYWFPILSSFARCRDLLGSILWLAPSPAGSFGAALGFGWLDYQISETLTTARSGIPNCLVADNLMTWLSSLNTTPVNASRIALASLSISGLVVL